MAAATPSRIARALAGFIGLVAAGGLLAWLLAWSAGAPTHAVDGLAHPSGVGFDALLIATVGFVLWCCLGWLAIVVLVEVGAAIDPGLLGHCCAGLTHRIAPRIARKFARWLVGLALLAGPLTSAPAIAASPSGTATPSPNLDRPVATAPARPGVAGTSTTAGYPTDAALDLDRPIGGYVATAPPAAVKVAQPDGVALLTGTARAGSTDSADSADASYVVRRGDTLWDIAARHLGPDATDAEIAREWPHWYATNRAVIGAEPNLLRPGEVLRAPR